MLYTVIKVSKSSRIRLRNTKAYRAVSFEELDYYINNVETLGLIIFEGSLSENFNNIVRYRHGGTITVVAYDEVEIDRELERRFIDNEVTCLYGLKALQTFIEDNFGYNVATYIKEHEENVVEIIETPDDAEKIDDTESSGEELSLFADSDIEVSDIEVDDRKRDLVKKSLAESLKAFKESTESIIDNKEDDEEASTNTVILSKDDLSTADNEDDIFGDKDTSVKVDESTEDVQKMLGEKDSIIDGLEEQLKITLEKLNSLSKIKNSLEFEKNAIQTRLNDIMVDDDVTEVIFGALDRDGYERKIKDLESNISELNIKLLDINSLNDRITHLNELMLKKEKEESELKAELVRLRNNTELDNAKAKVQVEVSSRLALSGLINSLITKLGSVQDNFAGKVAEYNNLMKEFKGLQETYSDLNDSFIKLGSEKELLESEFKSTKQIYEDRIQTLISDSSAKAQNFNALQVEKSSIELSLSDALREVESKDSEIKKLHDDYRELTDRNTNLQEKLKSTAEAYNKAKLVISKQRVEIEKFSTMDVKGLKDTTSILEQSNNSMMAEVGKYQKRLIDAEEKINKQSYIIETLKKQNAVLSQTNTAVTRSSTMSEDINFSCDYTGKAHIIPVTGSGSVGVTTTALSLCYKLRGRVLFIDFDIVSPKAEMYLSNVSPIIKGLPGFNGKESEMYQTGLGAFIYKDIDYLIDNEMQLVKTITRSKDGFVLDYLSGLYAKTQLPRYMAADFTQLFTYFGNKYDYIVCDMGRLGGSEVQNALIRMADRVAFKTVLVALHNRVDMRSLALRIKAEKLDLRHCIWLLNMSKNAAMDNVMQKCVGKVPYVIMPKKMDIYGECYTFDKVNILKDKLSELCSKILQG